MTFLTKEERDRKYLGVHDGYIGINKLRQLTIARLKIIAEKNEPVKIIDKHKNENLAVLIPYELFCLWKQIIEETNTP